MHFATHGLLASETGYVTNSNTEPGLILTPPQTASRKDDGLLTASEITQLKLNADWVILSACNTAAGDKLGAEAFTGLAKAFFYAGTRAILASHWQVNSEATVKLITKTFERLKNNSELGRSEALRQSMLALINDTSRNQNPHPSIWAPFIVIGEGANTNDLPDRPELKVAIRRATKTLVQQVRPAGKILIKVKPVCPTCRTYKIIRVAKKDVLNIRRGPSARDKIIGSIPPDGRGIYVGSEQRGKWAYVKFGESEGWVDMNYLMPDPTFKTVK